MFQSSSSGSSSINYNYNINNMKKSVRFNSKAKMRLALHISDYEEEEMEASFYRQNDYRQFRQDAKSTAQQVDKKNHANEDEDAFPHQQDDDFCVRGVECMTMEGSARRAINRRMAYVAVFVEQERLRFQEPSMMMMVGEEEKEPQEDEPRTLPFTTLNGESLAETYAIAACASAALAHRTGLADEEDAKALESSASSNDTKGDHQVGVVNNKKSKKTTSLLKSIADMDWSSRSGKSPIFSAMNKKQQNKSGVYLRRLVGGTAPSA